MGQFCLIMEANMCEINNHLYIKCHHHNCDNGVCNHVLLDLHSVVSLPAPAEWLVGAAPTLFCSHRETFI